MATTLITAHPLSVDGLRTDEFAFSLRTEAEYETRDAKLYLTVGTADAPEGHSSILVDIDVVRELDPALSLAESIASIEQNKRKVSEAFEAVITNRAREMFNG